MKVTFFKEDLFERISGAIKMIVKKDSPYFLISIILLFGSFLTGYANSIAWKRPSCPFVPHLTVGLSVGEFVTFYEASVLLAARREGSGLFLPFHFNGNYFFDRT